MTPSLLFQASVLGVLFGQPSVRESAQKPPRVSVCEVFQQIDTYRNKLVTVTGIYYYGLRDQCPNGPSSDGIPWPTAIDLVNSESPELDEEPVDFATEFAGFFRLLDLAEALLQRGQRGNREIVATITGKLHIQRDYRQSRGGKGLVGTGFGHLGVFPARMVVLRVDKVRVRPKVPPLDRAGPRK